MNDLLKKLRDLAIEEMANRTHYANCHESHLACALLWACDEIESLRISGNILAKHFEEKLEPLTDNELMILKVWEEVNNG